MKFLRIFSLIFLCLLSIGCSSKEKKSDVMASAKSAPHSVTDEDMLQKYSLTELNGAATLLRAVIDEAGSQPKDDKEGEIAGCSLTSRQASAMTMPVKSLIDQMMPSEIDAYTRDPKSYAAERGFETCAAICGCGVLSDVLEATNKSLMPRGSSRNHARNKQSLSVKATHQSAGDTLACARKQTWFCSSDLKAYLEKDTDSNAD